MACILGLIGFASVGIVDGYPGAGVNPARCFAFAVARGDFSRESFNLWEEDSALIKFRSVDMVGWAVDWKFGTDCSVPCCAALSPPDGS